MLRFLFQIMGFSLAYTLALIATFPFLVYWGAAKPWQKCVEFLMVFPVDNEKIGIFSLPGMIGVIFLNGLLVGIALVGLFNIAVLLRSLF